MYLQVCVYIHIHMYIYMYKYIVSITQSATPNQKFIRFYNKNSLIPNHTFMNEWGLEEGDISYLEWYLRVHDLKNPASNPESECVCNLESKIFTILYYKSLSIVFVLLFSCFLSLCFSHSTSVPLATRSSASHGYVRQSPVM